VPETAAIARPDALSRPAAPEPAESVVRLEGIRKRFPLRRGWRATLLQPGRGEYQDALRDVDLTVRRGELFGLLGRNGAGKTTLFKILATLVLPDEGTAAVAGHDVVADPAAVRRRLVPVIPYERSLYWRLSARENLALYAALHGFASGEARRRTDRVLEVVGLADTGGKQVGLFSSGMKQRLLIGRALLADPEVLLLDEPTRSLDPVTARDLRAFLKEEVNRGQGCTVLLATHDADEVRELCDRVGILEEGRLLVSGAVDALLRSVGENRYRLVARGDVGQGLRELHERKLIGPRREARPLEDGWLEAQVDIPGGNDAAAAVLAALVRGGLEVAALGRRELPLAELIESVVARARTRADGGIREDAR
jgi:ABC-2 type transport system ATP-binding protein